MFTSVGAKVRFAAFTCFRKISVFLVTKLNMSSAKLKYGSCRAVFTIERVLFFPSSDVVNLEDSSIAINNGKPANEKRAKS